MAVGLHPRLRPWVDVAQSFPVRRQPTVGADRPGTRNEDRFLGFANATAVAPEPARVDMFAPKSASPIVVT